MSDSNKLAIDHIDNNTEELEIELHENNINGNVDDILEVDLKSDDTKSDEISNQTERCSSFKHNIWELAEKCPAINVRNDDSVLNIFKSNCLKMIDDKYVVDVSCVLIDEAQFFTEKQIYEMSDIVDLYNIPVIAYGLKSDFKQELFPGSKALFSICDVIENIPVICWCGKKATVNARISNDTVIYEGAQILVGGNDSYISLCRKHWKEGKIKK